MASPTVSFHFNNSYAHLPERFFERIRPVPVRSPKLIRFNFELAEELGISTGSVSPDEWASIFSGNKVPEGAEPIAIAYAGHQFGHFVPQLGDGRAILLGEVLDREGRRRDIQLKGSGKTRFSRDGDGRAALGPMIREYIISEAMHALGIPTTRSLALVSTGETVCRETIQPGAVLTRVAASHIRVGTFEYFAARQDVEAIKVLADHAIDRHFPECRLSENPYAAFLENVVTRQAFLVARWMQVGFIHGVMNTDNTALSGETIDYGPCAFMDAYDPAAVFSSIDHHGRYAFGNQAPIAGQNLGSLAACLLPLLHEDPAQALDLSQQILGSFRSTYDRYGLEGMCAKIGMTRHAPEDLPLLHELLEMMRKDHVDHTLGFRYLSGVLDEKKDRAALKTLFADQERLDQWLVRWRGRLAKEEQTMEVIAENMRRVNPLFIPRNHLVERVIRCAVDKKDLSEMERLIRVLSRPYDEQPESLAYRDPPEPEERVTQTFCGT